PRSRSDAVSLRTELPSKLQWSLGAFEGIAGTDYLMAPAMSNQRFRPSYYDKEESAVRNYLFVNSQDLTSRWLLPHNKYLCLSVEKLAASRKNPNQKQVKWLRI